MKSVLPCRVGSASVVTIAVSRIKILIFNITALPHFIKKNHSSFLNDNIEYTRISYNILHCIIVFTCFNDPRVRI